MMATKDAEGFWRGSCRNHSPGRFGGCKSYVSQEGTNRCGKCNCVARSHFVISNCKTHSYCEGYEEIRLAVGECANCGCSVADHTITDRDSLPTTALTVSHKENDTVNETTDVWGEVAKAAKLERQRFQTTNPPLRKGKKAHGGPRTNSGRKKAVYNKDVQICPVRIKNRDLGTFSTCGKRIFVSLKGKPLTLETLEEESLKACCGMTRSDAIRFDIEFFILKTLKGPRLEEDQHIQGSSFYLYCSSSDGLEQLLEDDSQLSLRSDFSSKSSRLSISSLAGSSNLSMSATSITSTPAPTTNIAPKSASTSATSSAKHTTSTFTSQRSMQPPRYNTSSAVALSMRSRNNILRSLKRPSTAPRRPPTDPSKMLGLGKSLALPPPNDEGRVTHSIELFHFVVDDDWMALHITGPESSILSIEGYPANPFQAGTFQMAYNAKCCNKCNSLELHDSLVFKQHKLEEYGVGDEDMIESLTDDAIHNLNVINQKRTAKEAQIAAVASALCHHFNEDCTYIPDYGTKISILPCYHVKLTSVVCPSWGVLEPFLSTTNHEPWYKFMNNDGQVIDDTGPAASWPPHVQEFRLKAESFSHWTFQKFKGKAFVCDLQGADFKLTDLEIASADNSLFGIGNLSTVALDNFKLQHKCNVYCAALGLQDPLLISPPRAEQSTGTRAVGHSDDEVTFNPRHHTEQAEGEVSHSPSETALESDVLHSDAAVKSTSTKNRSQEPPRNLCNICLEGAINSVFYECGHSYACFPCAEKCAEMKVCPVCRQAIKDVVRLFF